MSQVGKSKFDPDPLWNGHIIEGVGGMTPRIPLPCCTLSLKAADWQNLSFPTNDAPHEFWTYGMAVAGMQFYFIFALTPDVPDDLYQAEVRPSRVSP